MATYRSTQRTNSVAVPKVQNEGNAIHAHLYAAFWQFTNPASDPVDSTDILELVDLPEGARILGVYIQSTDQGVDFSIGTEADPDRWVSTVDASGQTVAAFQTLRALATSIGFGDVIEAGGVTAVAVPTAESDISEDFNGFILYAAA